MNKNHDGPQYFIIGDKRYKVVPMCKKDRMILRKEWLKFKRDDRSFRREYIKACGSLHRKRKAELAAKLAANRKAELADKRAGRKGK